MSSDTVIQAIEAALNASPNDEGLLLHLAQLLRGADQSEKGLAICQRLLALNPVHLEGLQLAAELAESSGKTTLLSGYQTLLNSLGAPQRGAEADSAPSQNTVIPLASSRAEPEGDSSPKRVRGAALRLVSEGDSAESFVDVEETNIYLGDVAGMEDVKKRLRLSFLAPLNNPELMKAFGKNVRGGLLLYGPPGCGKTYIARALAGELGAKFISIGLSDILDMYIGESEKKLHSLFQAARQHAPSVLFIDEIDAIGQKRSQLKSSGLRTLVNQLLTELDSLDSNNENLFVLAATNHPWDVDAALKRPGRFDRTVAVFPPDEVARHSLFEYYLKDRPVEGKLEIQSLVKATRFFSGADIAHICNSAVEYALEESIETGTVRPISMKDLKRATAEHRASTLGWFETARNYAMFANESGAFDDLLEFINKNKL